MSDVREILKKRPLLFDGGMGTYYKAKPGQECEQANLLDPEGVLAVHGAYLEAGADAIKTNTFGLPRMAAAGNPLWEALTDEGWRLAAQATAKTGAAVFADLGPAPDTESLPAAQIYTALAERFAALGAKNFLFETLSSDAGVAEAAKQIKEAVPDAFVLVSFAVLPDGYTREGRHCTQLVRSMTACGAVDAVGLNCVSAPGAMRTLVQQLGRTELPLSVMPNAGYPVVTRTRVQYQGRPEYFARELGYGEEAEFWGLVGLLHDLDFEKYPEQHCIKEQQLMREAGLDERLIRAAASHGYGLTVDIKPEHEMEKVLYATDELTGLIGAVAIMRPSRSVADLELKSVKKKFKTPAFAAGCSREVIQRGADMLGWSLDVLIERTILAMRATPAARWDD